MGNRSRIIPRKKIKRPGAGKGAGRAARKMRKTTILIFAMLWSRMLKKNQIIRWSFLRIL